MDDLDRLDCLSNQCRHILRGLLDGYNHYVSSSEIVAIKQLAKYGFVETWTTVGGFPAVSITTAGKEVIKQFDNRGAS